MPALSPELLDAYEQCRVFTRQRATNFYVAFAILPPDKRRAIYAAYAYSGMVDDAVDDAGSDQERATALDSGRQLLAATYGDANPDSADPAWLTRALGDAVDRYRIPRDHFEQLVQGMDQDLRQTRYSTFADLEAYCYRAASVIGLICIEIFGYDRRQSDAAVQHAIAMGQALQLTNIMRDVREDAERGRIYLAQEDLAAHGLTDDDILHGVYDARFRALMSDYAQRAYDRYRQGEALLPLLDGPRSRACCNGLQGVYRTILDAIVARNYDVWSERVSPSRTGRVLRLLELWTFAALPNALRNP